MQPLLNGTSTFTRPDENVEGPALRNTKVILTFLPISANVAGSVVRRGDSGTTGSTIVCCDVLHMNSGTH